MKILYGARLAMFDLLRVVGALATNITKWDSRCDRMLYRLVCYIHSSSDLNLRGYVGDSADLLQLT
eukprot:8982322-Heterocapsa_arctica.AAC.1